MTGISSNRSAPLKNLTAKYVVITVCYRIGLVYFNDVNIGAGHAKNCLELLAQEDAADPRAEKRRNQHQLVRKS